MDAPEGLSPRGAALWAQLDKLLDLEGPAGVLAHEACRCADRLEKLDRYLTGQDEWFRLMSLADGAVHRVIVDAVLSETRQQQGRFAHLLAALGVEVPKKSAAPAPAAKKGTPLDELQAKRATRTQGGRAKSPARTPRGRQPR